MPAFVPATVGHPCLTAWKFALLRERITRRAKLLKRELGIPLAQAYELNAALLDLQSHHQLVRRLQDLEDTHAGIEDALQDEQGRLVAFGVLGWHVNHHKPLYPVDEFESQLRDWGLEPGPDGAYDIVDLGEVAYGFLMGELTRELLWTHPQGVLSAEQAMFLRDTVDRLEHQAQGLEHATQVRFGLCGVTDPEAQSQPDTPSEEPRVLIGKGNQSLGIDTWGYADQVRRSMPVPCAWTTMAALRRLTHADEYCASYGEHDADSAPLRAMLPCLTPEDLVLVTNESALDGSPYAHYGLRGVCTNNLQRARAALAATVALPSIVTASRGQLYDGLAFPGADGDYLLLWP